MPFIVRTGRLFWKLTLALWVSIILASAGISAYLTITGQKPSSAGRGGVPTEALVSGGLAVLLVGTVLAWYLSRPLHHLRRALQQIGEGDLNTRVAPLMGNRRDEIADLAREFDRMATQLQQLTESRKQLLHDISHELRSPLTRMEAAIGLMRQDPAQTPAMVERIARESGRLDALIEELLTLHRLEAGAVVSRNDRVDVIELLRAIADDAEFEAHANSRTVLLDAPGEFVTVVNGELIYRALENVVRNAVKFTRPDTAVEISAHVATDGAELIIQVKDRGPGVPQHKLEAIFEPFTRVEGSEAVRGVGLGLAIARRAVTLHGGRVEAAPRDGGGLVISIRIPARRDSASLN
jgi:signal transduction histidine kinase